MLHHAAMAGKRLIVEEPVAHGAESKPDRLGRTAAAQRGARRPRVGRDDADRRSRRRRGQRAGRERLDGLHHAAQYGHLQVTRALLDEPTLEPSRRDAYGVTPLHKAVSFGHAAVVAALVADRRVEVDWPIGTPTVPAAYAAQTGRETALHLAASHTYHFNHTRHTRIARLLLDGGADRTRAAASADGGAPRRARRQPRRAPRAARVRRPRRLGRARPARADADRARAALQGARRRSCSERPAARTAVEAAEQLRK